MTEAHPRPGLRVLGSVLRLGLGAVLLLFALVCVFGSVETDEPGVTCGGPAVGIAVGARSPNAPASFEARCRSDASAQALGGAILFGLPGLLLLAGPRLAAAAGRRNAADRQMSGQTGEWRFGGVARGVAVAGIAAIALLVAGFAVWGSAAVAAGVALACLPEVLILHRGILRPRLVLSSQSLVITNPVRRFTIPWTDIVRVEPGYWGLAIQRSDGSTVTASVGQKSNWASWRGKHVRGDDVAEAIAREAAKWQGTAPAGFVPAAAAQADKARATGRRIAFALAGLALVTVLRIWLESRLGP